MSGDLRAEAPAEARRSLREDALAEARRSLRADALAEARAWLGTPYRHQASAKGAGADCLGLVRGVWRALYGAEPQRIPAYRPDWAEAGGRETLLEAARRWLAPLDASQAQAGDVLLFRMAPGAVVKHAALMSAAPTETDRYARILHAYWGRAVVESWLTPWWKSRLVAAFTWPARSDPKEPAWPR